MFLALLLRNARVQIPLTFVSSFRIPASDQTATPGAVKGERDAWVQAIDKLCLDWKRKSMGELMFVGMKDVCSISIDEESSDLQSNSGVSEPPASPQTADQPAETGTASPAAEEDPEPPSTVQPVPKPRISKDAADQDPVADVPPPARQLTPPRTVPSPSAISSPPSPSLATVGLSNSPSESLGHESGTAVAKGPLPPILLPPLPPPAPPLPIKLSSVFGKARTKAFHWDVVSPDKVAASLEVQT